MTQTVDPDREVREVALEEVALEMVHKTVERDAFPTGWSRLGDDSFVATATIPHDHPFFTPTPNGLHDPLLVIEVMRQVTMLIAHGGFDVPAGHHFLLTGLDFTCFPEHLEAGSQAAEIRAEVNFSDIVLRGGRLTRMRSDVVLRKAEQVITTGQGRITVMSPQVYRRLRGVRTDPGRPGPVPPAVLCDEVGRTSARDVVLSATDRDREWLLRVDTRHPTFFQRQNDHVPGMMLLEAARQAGSAVFGPSPFVPVFGGIAFDRYAEFDSPCLIRLRELPAEGPGSRAVEVTGHQDGSRVFVANLTAFDEPASRGCDA